MGALAALLREEGHDVTGSDAAFDPPIGPMLQSLGIGCRTGYDPAHLEPRPDLVVVGNAIRRTNPEAMEAERLGLTRASMSETLRSRFLAKRRPLVVAGTHGKTTTTAMSAWILWRAGLEPGWFIGGIPKGLPGSAAIGSSRVRPDRGRAPFVIEGDEYDAVYWAKHPKFLDYVGITSDEIAIVTSIEHDHIDIYPDATSYEAAFRELLGRMPAGGLVVADAHDPRVRAVVSEASRARVAWVALEGDDTGDQTPTWLGAPVGSSVHGASAFDLFAGGVSCGRFFLQMPGRHNVRNAIAAIAACAEGFGVAPADARAHLAAFEGVRRRQDLIGQPHGVFVYDDFAHHPTAVDETLRALRARHPTGALWAVFEPRSATACRSLHQEAYATSFAAADHVLLAPVGRSNVPEGDRLDTARLTRDLGAHARDMPDVPAIVAEIASRARPHDCVAILSNGAFGGIHRMLVEALEALDD